MLFRNKSLPFVEEWIEVIEADDTIWDQNAFNDLARRGQKIMIDDPKHYFLADHGKLNMGVLPVGLFCSGHTYFTQRLPETLGVEPYAVHATFQFSGTDGKRHRFRERQLWKEHPAYVAPKGKTATLGNCSRVGGIVSAGCNLLLLVADGTACCVSMCASWC